MSRFQIATSASAQPFWDATKDRILVLRFCKTCKKYHHYPRNVCPYCYCRELGWKRVSGKGTVYAASVSHKPGMPMINIKVPYVFGLVELDEGPRLMTNIVGWEEPYEVLVGDEVTVAWEEAAEGRFLPVFELKK